MIKFISLSLQNFLSYGANTTVIDLQQKGTTLILGKNLDDTSNGTRAMGTGKSTIIQALTYAVYGKPLANISLPNLVNHTNLKNMEVTVTFEKDGTYYHIVRARKSKNGNFMKFFSKKDSTNFTDDDEHTRDTSKTNEEIQKIIGMPFELFCRIVVFSATHLAFLDLPLPQQTKIIEELFSLTILTEDANLLKDRIKDTERSLEVAETKLQMLKEEQERYDYQIESAKDRIERWNVKYTSKVKAIETTIQELSEIDVEKELKAFQELEKLRQETKEIKKSYEDIISNFTNARNREKHWKEENLGKIAEIQVQLKKIEGIDVDKQKKLHETLKHLQEELRIVNLERGKLGDIMSELDLKIGKKYKEIKHLSDSKCPYCLQDFLNAKEKMVSVTKELDLEEKQMEELSTASYELNEEIRNISSEIKSVRKFLSVDNLDEIIEIKEKQSQLEQSLKVLHETSNPFTELVESFDEKEIKKLEKKLSTLIKKEKDILSLITQEYEDLLKVKDDLKWNKAELNRVKKETNPYIEQLEELEKTKPDKINTKEVNSLVKLIKHQKFLRNLLTKKDSFIRKELLANNIKFLNTRLQTYLSDLGLPHTIEFTHNLTASITKFGKPLDFGNLSHGQQSSLNIALSLAFRDLLESMHTPVNVFILDEVLDKGLDAVGIEYAARLLKKKTREQSLSTFIISHKNEIDRAFDRILTVTMEDEFSFIAEG